MFTGLCSIGKTVALLLGPLVGGFLYEYGGYYAVFAISFALIFLDLVCRLILIEKDVAAKILGRTTGIYWTTTYGNNGTPSIVPSPLQTEMPEIVFLMEGSDETVMVPQSTNRPRVLPFTGRLCSVNQIIKTRLAILGQRQLLTALSASFVQVVLLAALDAALPIFVHLVFSWSSEGAGLVFLPLVAPAFMAPYIGHLADKYGSKWFVSAGFMMACPLWALLGRITHDGTSGIVLFCALLGVLGFALTLVGAPLMVSITLSMESYEARRPGSFGPKGAIAQANAFYSSSFAAGCLVGPLWAGVVEEFRDWKTMTWSFALLSGIMAVVVVMFIGSRLGKGVTFASTL